MDERNQQDLYNTFESADTILLKKYVNELYKYPIIEPGKNITDIKVGTNANDTTRDTNAIAELGNDDNVVNEISFGDSSANTISYEEDKNRFKHSEFRFSSAKIKQRLADF